MSLSNEPPAEALLMNDMRDLKQRKQRPSLSNLFPDSLRTTVSYSTLRAPLTHKTDASTSTLTATHSHPTFHPSSHPCSYLKRMNDKPNSETDFLHKCSTLRRLTKRESGLFSRTSTAIEHIKAQTTDPLVYSSESKVLLKQVEGVKSVGGDKVDAETQTSESHILLTPSPKPSFATTTATKLKKFATLSKQRSVMALNSWRQQHPDVSAHSKDENVPTLESLGIKPKTLSKRRSMFVLKSWQPNQQPDTIHIPNTSASKLNFRTLTKGQGKSMLNTLFEPSKQDESNGETRMKPTHSDKFKYFTLSKKRSRLVQSEMAIADSDQGKQVKEATPQPVDEKHQGELDESIVSQPNKDQVREAVDTLTTGTMLNISDSEEKTSLSDKALSKQSSRSMIPTVTQFLKLFQTPAPVETEMRVP